jgi:hypothetical protein
LKSSTTERDGLSKLFTRKSLTGTTALLVYLGIADFIVHMFFAVNFLGKCLGLPEAISGHNSCFIWGPGSCTGQVLITVGEPLSSANSVYKNVSLLTTITCQYCMDLENNLPVYLCPNPNFTSLSAEWQQVKQYD